MKRQESALATPSVEAAGHHVGTLVRQVRLAFRWTLAEQTERSRVSTAPLKRIEGGALSASLGAWLAVLEWVCLLPRLAEIRDPASKAVLDATRAKRSRRKLTALDMPRTRVETLADGRQVMLIERFDRVPLPGGLGRLHMVSALTLLPLHEQDSPDSSYAAIADALSEHGVGGSIAWDRSELYARMVFNTLVSNDNDHLPKHAFLYDPPSAGWRLSPLYDVVPKPQAARERVLPLSVGPQGRLARLDNALAGAGRFGLLPPDAAKIIDRVVRAMRSWREAFERLGVSARECDRVVTAFRRAIDIGMRDVERLL